MYKFFRKPKFIKIICFLLISAFSVNIAGCGNSDNGLIDHIPNYSVGYGSNTVGYTVYSQSTFDQMTKDVFIGYLLNGREFTLVVVPGKGDGSDKNPYEVRNSENMLFSTSQSGVYKYNESMASFEKADRKLLLYYVTDKELYSWFNEFAKDESHFIKNAMDFVDSTTTDVERPSRFKCEQLVNMGSGLADEKFCGTYNEKEKKYTGGIISNSTGVFTDEITGGMILLFGYGSIEGFITYDDVVNYEGSEVANNLVNGCPESGCYNPSTIEQFNYNALLSDTSIKNILKEEYGYQNFSYIDENLKSDIISVYTEVEIKRAKPGYEKLKTTYELLGKALLTDNNYSSLKSLKTAANSKKASGSASDKDKWSAIYEMVDMIDEVSKFNVAAKKEAFDIKLSMALYSRYDNVIDYPSTNNLVTGKNYNNKIGKKGDRISYEQSLKLIDGNNVISPSENSYLLLVTSDGFVLERGTEGDQISLGAQDMLDMGSLLAELVRMDGCPNKTIAADMYNKLANLKIITGTALAIAGVSAVAVAGIGLAAASVIAKLAAVSSITPVPGARIVALVLLGIAGLVTLGAGLVTLFSGLSDKSRLKGLGASEDNYCDSYVATFNTLFESLSLTIPVYHYEIPKEKGEAGKDLSINTCLAKYDYDEELRMCVKYDDAGNIADRKEPFSVPLYYYANLEQAENLRLEGSPTLMYFNEGKLVDYIFGASTPGFIVEILRLWGLLAMREIVYTSTIENNKINVYHTTNTNARTHTIYSAKHCFTLDYAKDLYSNVSSGDPFCYDINGLEGAKEIKFNGNNGYNYIENSNGKVYKLFESSLPNNESGLKNALEKRYGNYFSENLSYKFNKYKKDKGIVTLENKEIVKAQIDSMYNTIVFKDDNENDISDVMPYTIYRDENGSVNNYYYLVDGYIYRASTDNYGLVELEKFASYKDSIEDFNISYGDGTSNSYTSIDFLNYLYGALIFSDGINGESDNLLIPVYFTVTIKEAPQTNYYKDRGIKKTCDEGEYVYYRSSGDYRCRTDAKLSHKDKPYKTTDFDSTDFRYYSSSVLVATIGLKLNQNGEFTLDIIWE